MKYTNNFFLLLLMLALPVSSMAGVRMYRYVDDNGQLVIRSSISPDKVALGYEVLDEKGRVLEKVDPLGDDASEKYKEKMEKQQAKQRQEEYDLSLIRRYSFVKDIEVERDRKLNELSVRVSILKGNLNGVRSELEAAYEEAAKQERKGKSIGDSLQKRIDGLEQKITSTEDVLKKREQAILDLEKEYEMAIKRFTEIQTLRGR